MSSCQLHVALFCIVAIASVTKATTLSVQVDTGSEDVTRYATEQAYSPSYNACRLRVTTESALFLQGVVRTFNPSFAIFVVRFPRHGVNFSVEPWVVLPRAMFWTYYIPRGVFPYLKWPIDFGILSLGTLDVKTRRDIRVDFDLQKNDTDCSIRLGQRSTRYAIGKALLALTEDYLMPIPDHTGYSYSYFCNLITTYKYRETTGYQLAVHLGFLMNDLEYSCIRTNKKPYEYNHTFVNLLDPVQQQHACMYVPNALSVLTLMYFPLVILKICAMFAKNDPLDTTKETSGYASLGIDRVQHSVNTVVDGWVYLTGTSPISITTLVGGLCGLINKHPSATSRLRRLIFLSIGPVIIYAQISVYYQYFHDSTMHLIKHGLPMRFMTLLGGVKASVNSSFVPYFGGPFFVLLGYHVLGIVFLVLPASFDDVVQTGLRDSGFHSLSPLFLEADMLERLSLVTVRSARGYRRLYRQSVAQFFLLFRPKFWGFVISFQKVRVNIFCEFAGRWLPEWLVIVICIVLLPLYIVVCIAECGLCGLGFGIPIINCLAVFIKGWMNNSQALFSRKSESRNRSMPIVWGLRCAQCVYHVVLLFGFLYFFLSFTIILIGSSIFISQIMVFCLIALVTYPSRTFGYLFFAVVILYYMFTILHDFGAGYLDLLADCIECSSHMEKDVEYAVQRTTAANGIVNGGRDHSPQEDNGSSNRTRGSNSGNLEVVAERTELAFVQHRGLSIGIPNALFKRVVEKHRPVHINLAMALIKLLFIVGIISLTMTLVFLKKFGSFGDIADVMHVIFLVGIGALPRVVEVVFSNHNYALKKELFARAVRATVVDFWRERHQRLPVQLD